VLWLGWALETTAWAVNTSVRAPGCWRQQLAGAAKGNFAACTGPPATNPWDLSCPPLSLGRVSAHVAVWHSSMCNSQLGCLAGCPEMGKKQGNPHKTPGQRGSIGPEVTLANSFIKGSSAELG